MHQLNNRKLWVGNIASSIGLSMSMAILLSISQPTSAQDIETPSRETAIKQAKEQYLSLQRQLAQGWNTWDVRSVLTHVYMPYAFAIDLNLVDSQGKRINRFLIGDRGADAPRLKPYSHSYDGYYTKIAVTWHGHHFTVETASEGTKNIILITPANDNKPGAQMVVHPKTIWMRGNIVDSQDGSFVIGPKDKSLQVSGHIVGNLSRRNRHEQFVSLDAPIAICCDADMSLEQAQSVIKKHALQFVQEKKALYDKDYDCYNGMQTVLGWDTFYDPSIRKVISPVSRIWSSQWFASSDYGGFTIFCWDTYFAAMMFAVDNKALAYANATEITKAITEAGFVPNCYYSNGFKSRDRSQPPVGSLAVWTIYNTYKEKWFLELLYNELLTWNRWWDKNRQDQGLLCQGSSPYEKVTYFRNEYDNNTRYGAILESGLDNSPMYDGVTFDSQKHLLEQNDVGITSLYVMDCEYLAKIADEIGRKADAQELRNRGDAYRNRMSAFWDEKDGFYYNRSTRNGQFNKRTSPTCFYPLLAKAPTSKQAKRMVKEHLLNKDEYWGKYIIPATPRNDKSFNDNEYWRGRIWGPLNFLVYMGLRNYDFPQVRKEFAEKSKHLFLQSWLKDGYVFENYNATTGQGDDTLRSDKFYHWGALLGYISLIENGKTNLEKSK